MQGFWRQILFSFFKKNANMFYFNRKISFFIASITQTDIIALKNVKKIRSKHFIKLYCPPKKNSNIIKVKFCFPSQHNTIINIFYHNQHHFSLKLNIKIFLLNKI